MKNHWTARSVTDYLFRIAADFIAQLENKMESLPISQDELAKKLGVTKGRVSQWINHPGNISLGKMIEYAKALGMKVSVVAYEDDDPENKKGPIDSEIFKICWEKSGKPRDFWNLQETRTNEAVSVMAISSSLLVGIPVGSINVTGQLSGVQQNESLRSNSTPTVDMILRASEQLVHASEGQFNRLFVTWH